MNTNTPKAALENIIQKMIKGLEIYALRQDAKQGYIDDQNSLIQALVAVHRSLKDETPTLTYSWIEEEISLMERRDPYLSGHNIILRTKPTGSNFSLITKNLYIND